MKNPRSILAWALIALVALTSPLAVARPRGVGIVIPPAITSAGLTTVFNNRLSAGPRITALTPIGSAGPFTNVTIAAGAVSATGNATIPAVDFTGSTLFITGATGTTATVTDAKLGGVVGYEIVTGLNSSGVSTGTSPNLSLGFCSVDYAGAGQGHSGPIEINGAGGTVTFNACAFKNAPRDYFVVNGAATVNVNNSYVANFGGKTDPADHLEYGHPFAGNFNCTGSYFNGADGPHSDGGFSGMFQLQGTNGAVNSTFDGCILAGTRYIGLLAVFSCKAVNFDVNLTVRNSAIEPGTGGAGWWIATQQAQLTLTGITGTFIANEQINQGGVHAFYISPLAGSVMTVSAYTGNFTTGAITGATSGATATVTATQHNHCTLTDGGGNWNILTNLPAVLS